MLIDGWNASMMRVWFLFVAGGSRVELDDYEALGAYLAGLSGRSCTLPFEWIDQLTGRTLPTAAKSAAWWADANGPHGSPVSRACLSAGWRVESVRESARQVRFVRFARVDGDTGAGRSRPQAPPAEGLG